MILRVKGVPAPFLTNGFFIGTETGSAERLVVGRRIFRAQTTLSCDEETRGKTLTSLFFMPLSSSFMVHKVLNAAIS